MDNEPEVNVQDLISLSYDQKPIEFQNAFNDLIGDKIAQAIQDRKMELAQSVFNSVGPDEDDVEIEDEEENETEYEDDDFEYDEDEEYDYDDEEDDELLNQEEEENGETA